MDILFIKAITICLIQFYFIHCGIVELNTINSSNEII